MKYTWLVEKYLEGELSGEALRKFELEILRNPEAAKELERIRSLQRFMENQHAMMSQKGGLIEDYDDLENVLQEHEVADELEGLKIRKINTHEKGLRDYRTRLTEIKANRTLQSRRSNKILVRKVSVWMAAASIALLIVTSSLYFIGGNRSIDYQSLYNKFYTPEPYSNTPRAPGAGEEDFYNEAMHYYTEENWQDAMEMFELIPEPIPNNYVYLYKGITAMESGNYLEAIGIFRQLETNKVLNQHRMWYTGLCYLAMEDGENARSIFEAIVEQEGHYMRQSKTILRKI